jgi:hypothetical protein
MWLSENFSKHGMLIFVSGAILETSHDPYKASREVPQTCPRQNRLVCFQRLIWSQNSGILCRLLGFL